MLKLFTFFDKVLIGVFRSGYILKDDPTDSFKSTRGVSWIGGPKEVHRPQADNVLLDWSFLRIRELIVHPRTVHVLRCIRQTEMEGFPSRNSFRGLIALYCTWDAGSDGETCRL